MLTVSNQTDSDLETPLGRVHSRAGSPHPTGESPSHGGSPVDSAHTSAVSPLGSAHCPMGRPHWGACNPQMEFPNGDCAIPTRESPLGSVCFLAGKSQLGSVHSRWLLTGECVHYPWGLRIYWKSAHVWADF